MSGKLVAVTRLIPGIGIEMLKEHFQVLQWESDAPPNHEKLKELLWQADAAVTLLSDRIGGELLDDCPGIKVLANMAVGYENIDLEAAAERGIWVTNTPDVLTDATADITMALILATTRRIVEADHFMRDGRYRHWDPCLLRGAGLKDKILGIIGFGRIGRAVAQRALAFGMNVIFHDPHVKEAEIKELQAGKVAFDDILAESDVLTLHCPYTQELHHLIDAIALNKMKKTAYFINTARGGLMDEKALFRALENKVIAGAGLDVYENEPEFVNGLAAFDNIVMLPHIGSATYETRNAMAELAARNVIEVLQGRNPVTPVNNPKEPK
jgi:glyoxylate reductase